MPTTNVVSANLGFTGTITNAEAPSCKEPARRRSFTNRFLDFWMLGGLSLAVFAFMFAQEIQYAYLLLAIPVIQLLIEFPHLIASYRLAYSRGREWIWSHSIALIFAPLALIAVSVTLAFLPAAQNQLGWTALVGLLFLTAGFHRVRQVYGIMIVYAVFDDYKLRPFQKRLLSYMLNVIWITGYVHMNAYPKPMEFFGVAMPRWSIPPWLLTFCNAALFVALMSFFTGVLLFNFMRGRRLPSPNFLVPWIAIMVWFWSYLVSVDFFLFLTPAFHALQYLACVAGYGRNERKWAAYFVSAALLVAAGYFVMRLVPQQMNAYFGFGVLGIYIFVSLHHYLLDSVIWRTSDPRVQRNLIGGLT